jgi:hypothetical protein
MMKSKTYDQMLGMLDCCDGLLDEVQATDHPLQKIRLIEQLDSFYVRMRNVASAEGSKDFVKLAEEGLDGIQKLKRSVLGISLVKKDDT